MEHSWLVLRKRGKLHLESKLVSDYTSDFLQWPTRQALFQYRVQVFRGSQIDSFKKGERGEANSLSKLGPFRSLIIFLNFVTSIDSVSYSFFFGVRIEERPVLQKKLFFQHRCINSLRTRKPGPFWAFQEGRNSNLEVKIGVGERNLIEFSELVTEKFFRLVVPHYCLQFLSPP